MSDTLLNTKMLSEAGKYVFIIDTMNELHDGEIAKELGHHNFNIFRYSSYEDTKRFITYILRETPKEMYSKCAVVISNAKYLMPERLLQICMDSPSDHLLEVNLKTGEEIPVVEVPCTDGFPEPETPEDTVVISELTRETFTARKKLKDLLKTVNEARDAGIAVVIVEGLEPVLRLGNIGRCRPTRRITFKQ